MSNIISLAQAFEALQNAAAIIVDEVVTYPALSDLEGVADNEFMNVSWTDEEGLEFSVRFEEGANATVKVDGSRLILVDTEGDEAEITILVPGEVARLEVQDGGKAAKAPSRTYTVIGRFPEQEHHIRTFEAASAKKAKAEFFKYMKEMDPDSYKRTKKDYGCPAIIVAILSSESAITIEERE